MIKITHRHTFSPPDLGAGGFHTASNPILLQEITLIGLLRFARTLIVYQTQGLALDKEKICCIEHTIRHRHTTN